MDYMHDEYNENLECDNTFNNNEKYHDNSNKKNQINRIKIISELNQCYNIFNSENNIKGYCLFYY